jgi:imidazolonepropionase-like amidohydrolase
MRTEAGTAPEPREQTLMARELRLPNIRPAMEYGRERLPEQPRDLLVRNATIWTMGDQGIMENADLLVRQGRVVEVGQNLRAPRNATIIDAEGKHVTPGLIDAHLHSGVTGVNEVGNAITAEVRMGDVLNIHNIWMYRQLAGGLTTAHVMHGSANAIGGQNVTLKMRWGALSHDLPLDGARRTIKFALGENPKRVGSNRYPDTRMGVEQIIADRFRMAEDYRARWQDWERNRSGIPPRRDLRLDALVDILAGDLDVHSHSYRQDEILMLMRLADDMGFRVTSFHHSLEAFKVAPELAERGIGAVVWSDWGGFKIEAYDNTNYNARLLHEAGVVTSLHSDDSQIATRMNWEAAKLVRTGLDREVALSMVTSTTARLLGIDDRVGSLEAGKDADFVIWSGDPLSTVTIAEQTWVDGRRYFDIREDAELQRAIDRERAELIRLIMEAGNE